MAKFRLLACLLGLAWLLSSCGAKPAMEGGKADSSEYGSVTEGGKSAQGGDSTSFNDENVEKVDEYVIRPGDNLWNIAAKGSVYHSGWLYPLIVKANAGKIKDPRDLKVGMTIKVPRGLPQGDYDVAREEAMAGVFEKESGPLQEMKIDLPNAPPPADADLQKMAGKKHGWLWLIWLILILLAAAGAWMYFKIRADPDKAKS